MDDGIGRRDIARYIERSLGTLKEPLFIVAPNCELLFANTAFLSVVGVQENESLQVESFWPSARAQLGTVEEFPSTFHLRDGDKITVRLLTTELEKEYYAVRIVAMGPRNDLWHGFRSQRLETLGMLAGGVAHDFNNILTGILGHITYLKTILPSLGAHVESLTAIEHGAKKSSLIVQQILNFAKLEETEEDKLLDLSQLVQGTCSLLRGAISPEFTLRYKVPDRPVMVYASEGRITQVIANLVINARDAIASQGFIEVGLEICEDKERVSKVVGPSARQKSFARLYVLDDGVGIPAADQAKIFEPFYSTKKEKGTGLGLTTVQAIVKLYRGGIELSSQEGVGTSISVYFPLSEEYGASKGEGMLPERLEAGTERILVVDDEYPVRNVLEVSLAHLGYKVETASSGLEAIERFQHDREGFDLVILDMLMPHLSGDQVFEQLKKINPSVRVLIISGFSSEEAVKRMLQGGARGFVRKPLTIQELSRKVRSCLD